MFFCSLDGDHRDLHVLTHSFPTRRASGLGAGELQALRDAVARVASERGPVLPFGVGPLDHLLAGGGLDGAGLHEVAAASASWSDDAAATLFAAGIAARFAAPGLSALWEIGRAHV